MTTSRTMKRSFLLALAGAICFASDAPAQDILEAARRHGTTPPRWMLERLERDPNAFEFQRAWKSELERVRATRANLTARGIQASRMAPQQAAAYGAAVTGTFRVPVIPILYANTSIVPYPASSLQNRLYGTTGSTLTTYYDEVSRGLFNLTGTVYDWVRVSRNDSYYEGTSNGLKPDSARLGELLVEVLDKIDATVDFSIYDRNGDGFVDFVAFVHPETGGECADNSGNIWSHRWVLEAWTGAPYQTNDGVLISDYVIQPAYNCASTQMIDIGVFAHEYGHALGLPDLYATNGANGGIGAWGLMGAGNWNRPASPAHMEAWSKAELGWIPVVTIGKDTTGLRIDPAETTGAAYRIDIPNARGEYFLLENRQRLGSDEHLLGTGLLVWHVDSVKIAQTRHVNTVQNDTGRKGLDLEEADGLAGLDDPRSFGGPGDPFPGIAGKTRFDDWTNPASRANLRNGTDETGIALSNIALSGLVVTLDVTFGAPAEVVAIWGDVDQDGAVTLADAELIYAALIGIPTEAAFEYGDVDDDGDVDARDALIIHSFVEKLDVTGFRVGQPVDDAVALKPFPMRTAPLMKAGAPHRLTPLDRKEGLR